MSLKAEMRTWIEENIQCCGYDIKDFTEPYTGAQFESLKIPCAQIRMLYDLINKFSIDIDYRIYNKYKKFANIKIG